VKLFHCSCPDPKLQRIERPIWLRLVPASRLYVCKNCRTECVGFVAPVLPAVRWPSLGNRSATKGNFDSTMPLM
jgi:hypothetical protein